MRFTVKIETVFNASNIDSGMDIISIFFLVLSSIKYRTPNRPPDTLTFLMVVLTDLLSILDFLTTSSTTHHRGAKKKKLFCHAI